MLIEHILSARRWCCLNPLNIFMRRFTNNPLILQRRKVRLRLWGTQVLLTAIKDTQDTLPALLTDGWGAGVLVSAFVTVSLLLAVPLWVQ